MARKGQKYFAESFAAILHCSSSTALKFGLFTPGKNQALMHVSKSSDERSHGLGSIHIIK